MDTASSLVYSRSKHVLVECEKKLFFGVSYERGT